MAIKPSDLIELSTEDLDTVEKLEKHIDRYIQAKCRGETSVYISVKKNLTDFSLKNKEEIRELYYKINNNVVNEIIKKYKKAGWRKVEHASSRPRYSDHGADFDHNFSFDT